MTSVLAWRLGPPKSCHQLITLDAGRQRPNCTVLDRTCDGAQTSWLPRPSTCMAASTIFQEIVSGSRYMRVVVVSLQLLRLICRLPPLLAQRNPRSRTPRRPLLPQRRSRREIRTHPRDLYCRKAAAAAKSAPTRAPQPFVRAGA
jgi:hypothetical protein